MLSFTVYHGDEAYQEEAAKTEGMYACQLASRTTGDWQYVRSEVFSVKMYWIHYCRRCGLQNSVLMWCVHEVPDGACRPGCLFARAGHAW